MKQPLWAEKDRKKGREGRRNGKKEREKRNEERKERRKIKKKNKKGEQKYLKFSLLKLSLHNDRWTRILNWNQWTDLFTILTTHDRKASKRLLDKSFIPYKCICIALCWYINAWAPNLIWCHSPALVLVSQATVRQGKCHRPGRNEWHSIFLEQV